MDPVSSSIVLIGPADALPALRERLASGAELRTFSSEDALVALEHIIRYRPRIVALDHEFSIGPRGTALIHRLKDDPALADCEVRVMARDPSRSAASTRPDAAPSPAGREAVPVLDTRGTRRAPRVRMAEGVRIQVDGGAATLVDLSAIGAQVVSAAVLKPNQRIRVVLGDPPGQARLTATVQWASFEMPKGMSPRYRAGIEFVAADPTILDAFAARHQRA